MRPAGVPTCGVVRDELQRRIADSHDPGTDCRGPHKVGNLCYSRLITPAASSGCRPCCTSAGASPPGNIFPGLEMPSGSNAARRRCMQSISAALNMSREVVALFHADAVLAGEGAAHLHAHAQDAAGERFGARERARLRGRRRGSADAGCRRRRERHSRRAARLRATFRRCGAALRRAAGAARRHPAR